MQNRSPRRGRPQDTQTPIWLKAWVQMIASLPSETWIRWPCLLHLHTWINADAGVVACFSSHLRVGWRLGYVITICKMVTQTKGVLSCSHPNWSRAADCFYKVLTGRPVKVFKAFSDVYEYLKWGRGFKPRPDQHSGSLNNWGESAALVMTSANG